MDATLADIYLVSRHDRSKVIGRPYIYLAVDTATQLIAGIYVGLECNETAVMLCLNNAALTKDSYCVAYGIQIEPEQWPSRGLPHEIITDKGNEFFGPRMKELCQRFGIEIQSLPPFRPDEKGLVEKAFDLIQQRYKSLLRGKGVIEPDAQERWAVDYRSQSILDLDEFTKIVIHCVLYINAGRCLADAETPAQKWLSADPQLLEVSSIEMLAMALPCAKTKLPRKGLRVNGLLYVPGDMNGLTLGENVAVCYDPSDLSLVYILMEDSTFKVCTLSPSQQQYNGLSKAEGDMLKREARERHSKAEKQGIAASAPSIQSIRQIIQTAEATDTDKKKQDGKEILENRSEERRNLT